MDAPDLLAQEKRRLDARTRWRGIDISIENRAGSTRHWVDGNTSGFSTMFADYGYFRLTEGADGEHLDVFVLPTADTANTVWVVDQLRRPAFTAFDEHKVILGVDDGDIARQTYLAHYSDQRFFGGIRGYDASEFAAFLREQRRCPEPGELESVAVRKSLRDGSDSAPQSHDPSRDDYEEPLPDDIEESRDMRDSMNLVTFTMRDGTVLRSLDDVTSYADNMAAILAGAV